MMKDRNKAAITIIESPEYDVMDRKELSGILGGWNATPIQSIRILDPNVMSGSPVHVGIPEKGTIAINIPL